MAVSKPPLFLGTAAKLLVDATTDGRHVRLHLEFRESPGAAPIEFVMSARMSMLLMKTLQDLQNQHQWSVPTGGVSTRQ